MFYCEKLFVIRHENSRKSQIYGINPGTLNDIWISLATEKDDALQAVYRPVSKFSVSGPGHKSIFLKTQNNCIVSV